MYGLRQPSLPSYRFASQSVQRDAGLAGPATAPKVRQPAALSGNFVGSEPCCGLC